MEHMNCEEIETCVIRAKEGNKEDILKLYKQFEYFIYKKASNYNIKNHDCCDLVQIGYLALDQSIKKYKVGSNTFKSYVYNAIINAFKYKLRQSAKENGEISLNTPLNDSNDNGAEFIDTLEAEENIEDKIINAEVNRQLHAAIAKLSKNEEQLIKSLYFNNHTLKNYSQNENINYSKAQRDRDRALRGLKGYLN